MVLAIITIIVAIVAPIAWSVRNKARSAVCINNLRQLGHSLDLYTQNWDSTLPLAPGAGHAGSLQPNDLVVFGPGSDGVSGMRGTTLPTASTYIRGVLVKSDSTLKGPIFQCPNDVGAKGSGAEAYGFNGNVYDLDLISYLWDPTAQPEFQKEDLGDGAATQSVNGASLGDLEETDQARLLQDYGTRWHTTISSSTERQGANGAEQRVIRGLVNVLCADFGVRSKKNTAVQPP